jgi:ribosomal protein S18 acetylase RimI-like enzyme
MPRQRDIVVRPVAAEDRRAALQMLFAHFPQDEQSSRIEATLRAVDAGTLCLDGLRWAWRHEAPVGAALAMPQPDGVTLVWPPTVADGIEDAAAVTNALLTEIEDQLDRSTAKMGQMLFDPEEASDYSLYFDHGFRHETHLFYVARNLHEPLPECDLGNLREEMFDEEANGARFAALIEDTYRDTQDCAWLEGLRNGKEALASHKLSGQWRRELWRLYCTDEGDAAVLLLNEHADQDAVELVYFGVAPRFRGRGYGRLVLAQATRLAADCERSLLFAAVDAENVSANTLYAEAGFVELARRTALFRFPTRLLEK